MTSTPDTGTDYGPTGWMVFLNPYEGGQWVGVLASMTSVSVNNGHLTFDITEVYGSGATAYMVPGDVRVCDSMAGAVRLIESLSVNHICWITAHSEGEMRLSGRAS